MIEDKALPTKETFFQGKSVVVTGGASGIGKAVAESLAGLGAHVTTVDIAGSDELSENITHSIADVSKLEELEETAVSVNSIDLLVIAAGVTSQDKEATAEEKATMDAVNVRGVENTLSAFGSKLNQSAQVVFIGSHAGPKPYYKQTKDQGAKIVTKFAQDHPETDVRIPLLGPVRTPLFLKGKQSEDVIRIEKNVGLYEPAEFADDLVDLLVQPSKGGGEPEMTEMYKQKHS